MQMTRTGHFQIQNPKSKIGRASQARNSEYRLVRDRLAVIRVLNAKALDPIYRLDRRDVLDCVCTADRFRARLGETEMQNFSFVDEVFDRTGEVFDGRARADAVLVEKIDAIRAGRLRDASATFLTVIELFYDTGR